MKRTCLYSVLLLVLAVVPLAAGCSPAAPVAQAGEEASAAVPVEVAEASTGSVDQVYSYAGNLESKESVRLVSLVGGRVDKVFVEMGDDLKAGDPIIQVQGRTYSAQQQQAKANYDLAHLAIKKMDEGTRSEQLTAAREAVKYLNAALDDVENSNDDERTAAAASMAAAEAALRLAQANYDKVAWAGQVGMTEEALKLEQATIGYEGAQAAYNLTVNPTDSKTASLRVQLAQARSTLALAERPFTDTDFDLARAKVDAAQAALKLAEIQTDETKVVAPFDGIVAEVYVTEGAAIGTSSPVVLFVSKEVQVVLNVEESRIGDVDKGDAAVLTVSAYPDKRFPGKITAVAPVADKSSHTFVVEVTPTDEGGVLRGGMYAHVDLLAGQSEAAVVVPAMAVTKVDGQATVYIVEEDVARARSVVTGLKYGDGWVEVSSGVKVGDTVVVAGQSKLSDGAAVEIVAQDAE